MNRPFQWIVVARKGWISKLKEAVSIWNRYCRWNPLLFDWPKSKDRTDGFIPLQHPWPHLLWPSTTLLRASNTCSGMVHQNQRWFESLSIEWFRLEAAFHQIAQFKSLRDLNVSGCRITPELLEIFRKSPIQNLSLRSCRAVSKSLHRSWLFFEDWKLREYYLLGKHPTLENCWKQDGFPFCSCKIKYVQQSSQIYPLWERFQPAIEELSEEFNTWDAFLLAGGGIHTNEIATRLRNLFQQR